MDDDKKMIVKILFWMHLAGSGIHDINLIIDEVIKLISKF
jgi:hypothetical protein